MIKPQLVLASGSPRRQQLLSEAGYQFKVLPARKGVEEAAESSGLCRNCGPATLVADLALAKGTDVVDQLKVAGSEGPVVVLAADTVAECDGHILGKPTDHEHARLMMQQLSGRKHRVYTGVFLTRILDEQPIPDKRFCVETILSMKELSETWIDDYVDSEKWMGKAGGFGYQDGLGFVQVVEGSESNVVGLPMELITERLAEFGVEPA